MAGNVKIIPPREKESSVLRVAAYCRVSTDHAEKAIQYITISADNAVTVTFKG